MLRKNAPLPTVNPSGRKEWSGETAFVFKFKRPTARPISSGVFVFLLAASGF
jgi:hypothetical protein